MNSSYDVAILGLGAMGSAAAFHLASRGRKIIGLDRFDPPHTVGSSHGQTRIIREAYFEHPLYVPLLQRAYELWSGLEGEASESLLRITGGLMIGSPGRELLDGAIASARMHRLPHRLMSAEEVRREFPALSPSDDQAAVWEPRAGILFPERSIAAHLKLARKHGADLHTQEPAMRWDPDGEGFRILTATGAYHAQKILITAGAWVQSLVPDLPLPLSIERQVQFWFDPKQSPDSFALGRCPIHLWETPSGKFFYGFPDLGEGIKVARHHDGATTSADQVDRVVHPDDEAGMRALIARYLPNANGPLRQAAVCIYTNTPDSHFWINPHPGHPGVLIASPCSGHGFKFASVMGEVLANELDGGETRFDLCLFRTRGVQGSPTAQ